MCVCGGEWGDLVRKRGGEGVLCVWDSVWGNYEDAVCCMLEATLFLYLSLEQSG